MLKALHDAMVDILKTLGATGEAIESYKKQWSDTLNGVRKSFPCPACFMAGTAESELKAIPARASTHYVRCKACSREYGYTDEDFRG